VLGVVLGAGLLNKVSVSWLCTGLIVGLLLTPQRRWLRAPWPWLGGAIALLVFAPFVWWQWRHGWPFLEFSRNAAELKVGEISLLAFLDQQVQAMQPLAVPIWIAGVVYCFVAAEGRYRLVGWIFVTVFLLLAASGSARPHYLGPAFSLALAAGGVAVERLARGRPWLPRAAVAALALSGVVAAPITMPILSPAATVRYIDAIGLRPREERESGGELPMHLGLYLHAEAGLGQIQRVYESLPPADRARVTIVTRSFGEAGAVNILGPARGLPPSVGVHNQYWLWGPGASTGELVIIPHDDEATLRQWFESCEKRAEIECSQCMQTMDAQSIFVCRRPRRPWREVWQEMKHYR
jgi:hypothetical protein